MTSGLYVMKVMMTRNTADSFVCGGGWILKGFELAHTLKLKSYATLTTYYLYVTQILFLRSCIYV